MCDNEQIIAKTVDVIISWRECGRNSRVWSCVEVERSVPQQKWIGSSGRLGDCSTIQSDTSWIDNQRSKKPSGLLDGELCLSASYGSATGGSADARFGKKPEMLAALLHRVRQLQIQRKLFEFKCAQRVFCNVSVINRTWYSIVCCILDKFTIYPTTHRNMNVNGRWNATGCYSIGTFNNIGVQKHLKFIVDLFYSYK